MDLSSHLAPPGFYLSAIGMGKFWLFTDVPVFAERYSSNLNVVPLPGANAPYVSQGAGAGRQWAVETKLTAFHKFIANDATTSARDPGSVVYEDLLEIKQFIKEYGPSPLMMLHMRNQEGILVALQDFSHEIALQEDTYEEDGQLPSTIPVSMTLIEVPEYRVRFD